MTCHRTEAFMHTAGANIHKEERAMKKNQIKVGGTYLAKVSGQVVPGKEG